MSGEHVTTTVSVQDVETFAAVRPRLFGIAYRMLGSVAEADDVLQEAWVRWQGTDRTQVRDPGAFLATTTTRLALNVAQSARARRETYIGPWLPEPIDTRADPALGAERGAALEVAVLMLLEHLTPTERAAYVLREAFDYSYRDIAGILDLNEDHARQLASRARRHLAAQRRAAPGVSDDERRRLLEAFVAAAQEGDLGTLEELLAADVVSYADGGGVVHAARVPLTGRARVARAMVGIAAKFFPDATIVAIEANGAPALLIGRDGGVIALATLQASAAGIERLDFQVNPDKLARLQPLL